MSKLFAKISNCYFCEKPVNEAKDKHHKLGGDGDSKLQCHRCYNRAAKLKCKKKRKLIQRYF